MARIALLIALLAAAAALPAAAQTGGRGTANPPQYQVGDRLEAAKAAPKDAGRYREVKWDELISPSWNPEAIIKSMNLGMMMDGDPRANAALEKLRQEWDNAPGNPALDGAEVRLAGFVVPLERAGNALREFLLVPYFGACIHVPPPPPNQIVLVRYPQGVALDDIYAPLWVSGTLQVEPVSNDLADAAYALDADSVRPVEEADL
jgi:hypothetical protein